MKKLTTILSEARNDFLKNESFDSATMKEVGRLFGSLTEKRWGLKFEWSNLKKKRWEYFVSDEYGPEGGIAMFPIQEPEDVCENTDKNPDELKCVGLSKPLSDHPYSIFYSGDHRNKEMVREVLGELDISHSVVS